MPAFDKMFDEKNTAMPVVITEVTPSATKPRKTKKYVIIAISGILAAAIILTAILVGMYMFTEAQKEIIKYTMTMKDNTKQEVTSDPNENVVKYHVSTPTQDSWIVNDFGKDLQVIMIKSDGKTDCFVSPLNRTNLLDPAKINGPESPDVKESESESEPLTYRSSDTPVTDTSFLGKSAKEMCKGISVYWLYPQCIDKSSDKGTNKTEVDHPKSKRALACVTMCCWRVCACTVRYYYYYEGGKRYCRWLTYTCPADRRVTYARVC